MTVCVFVPNMYVKNMTKFALNMTGVVLNMNKFFQNMTGFILNNTRFVLNITGFVLNTTGRVLYMTAIVLNMTGSDDDNDDKSYGMAYIYDILDCLLLYSV